jgi:hypothetical protein
MDNRSQFLPSAAFSKRNLSRLPLFNRRLRWALREATSQSVKDRENRTVVEHRSIYLGLIWIIAPRQARRTSVLRQDLRAEMAHAYQVQIHPG